MHTHTHKALTSPVATQLTRMKLVSAIYLYTNSKSKEMPPREVLLLRIFRQRALKQGERNPQLVLHSQAQRRTYQFSLLGVGRWVTDLYSNCLRLLQSTTPLTETLHTYVQFNIHPDEVKIHTYVRKCRIWGCEGLYQIQYWILYTLYTLYTIVYTVYVHSYINLSTCGIGPCRLYCVSWAPDCSLLRYLLKVSVKSITYVRSSEPVTAY